MSFPHWLVPAAHAARQRRLRQQQDRIEEEEMTNYSVDDLENDWEFKIVRSERGNFRKPETFQRLMQEEAAAGWEMVEKLDDRRVRFKRRKETRRRDATLAQGIDPYRTQFDGGVSRSLVMVLIGLITMSALGAGVLVFGLEAGGGEAFAGATTFPVIAISAIAGLVFVGMLAVIVARRR
jgi:hypothetical protein